MNRISAILLPIRAFNRALPCRHGFTIPGFSPPRSCSSREFIFAHPQTLVPRPPGWRRSSLSRSAKQILDKQCLSFDPVPLPPAATRETHVARPLSSSDPSGDLMHRSLRLPRAHKPAPRRGSRVHSNPARGWAFSFRPRRKGAAESTLGPVTARLATASSEAVPFSRFCLVFFLASQPFNAL